MLVQTFGSAVYGVEAITITVEVNVLDGSKYYIVGLPIMPLKKACKE
jgi:magnesium chelatase family protein